MAEWDVNFGAGFNLTVDIEDEDFQYYLDQAREYLGLPEGLEVSGPKEKELICSAWSDWATSDLENEETYVGSANVRFFPGDVTSASKLNDEE